MTLNEMKAGESALITAVGGEVLSDADCSIWGSFREPV